MPAFPDSYAQTADGKLMIADGMNPVKIWDGLSTAPIDAGLAAPTSAITLAAGSGVGEILGTYAAYLRFIDDDGNPSSLSPISTIVQVEDAIGDINDATDTSPIEITTSASHGLTSGDVVRIESVEGNTASNGTWEVTVTGADTFTLDGSIGNGAWTAGGYWTPGSATIEYSDVPTTTNPKVARKQILRNTDGQFSVFYVDVDTDDLAGTDFTSSLTDDELADQTAVPLLSEDGAILANANDPPPDYKCVLCNHSSRMFAAVDRIYDAGSVAVTSASATVSGFGTAWTPSLVGRYLYVDGAVKSYLIESVNVSAQTLTLSEAYASTTNLFAIYAIAPAPANRRIINYTRAGYEQSWSPTYGIELQDDGDDITGLMAKGSFLYILEYRHIYRFTFQSDPAVDGFIYQSCQRGVVNNRCWVQVEDNTYMLDKDGIHAFGGGQESEPISPPIQKIFQTPDDSDRIVNWNARDLFHAAHFPTEEVIRWFVSMGDNAFPRHAIVLHYRTKRWWTEEYPRAITASCLGLIGLARTTFLGSEGYKVLVGSSGFLDGIDKNKGTMHGNVTSADICSVTDGAAVFTQEYIGLQIAITGGKGVGQRRTIHFVLGTRLSVTDPWTVIPDSTSTYQVAGISYQFRGTRYRWSDSQEESDPSRKFAVLYKPSPTPSPMYLRVYHDQNTTPVRWKSATNEQGVSVKSGDNQIRFDLTNVRGYLKQSLPDHLDDDIQGVRSVSFEMVGVGGDTGAKFFSFVIDGVR